MNRSRLLRRPSRRVFLQSLAAAVGAAGLVGCGREAPETGDAPPFPLGVASGEATPDGALLWTHYTGTDVLRLRVWHAQAPETEPSFQTEATPSPEGFVRAEVTGLAPGTRYRFAFEEQTGGARSRTGHFRTAVDADALVPLRLGATSCTRHGYPMDTLAHAGAREDLDLFLLLGDAVYADGSLTAEAYRKKWADTLVAAGQRALRASTSLLATWDDHEFQNNWEVESFSPGRFGLACESFFEHMPMRRLPEAPHRLWRSVRWGRTAELFILDSRGERRPSTRLTAQAEYVSRAQLDWLKAGLRDSPCTFKLILNSVPISEFPGALFQATVDDRWEGFPAQRRELLEHVESHAIPGVLWVSGDFHLASMGRVSRSGPGASAIEVLVGPGANFSNPSPSYPAAPQFDWSTGINNYAVLDLLPDTREVELTYHDGAGRVLAQRRYAL